MDIKSLVLSAVIFIVCCFTSTESLFICDLERTEGESCSTCDFLTFCPENNGEISFFCPMKSVEERYCCYDLMRRPFCCNSKKYFLNVLFWIAAVMWVIYGVINFIKCLINCVVPGGTRPQLPPRGKMCSI